MLIHRNSWLLIVIHCIFAKNKRIRLIFSRDCQYLDGKKNTNSKSREILTSILQYAKTTKNRHSKQAIKNIEISILIQFQVSGSVFAMFL